MADDGLSPAPAIVDLLRHGQPKLAGHLLGWRDEALTDIGWKQMRAALGTNVGWDRVCSSPLQRCAAFADEVARRSGSPVQLDERWRELHFGDWEGRSTADLHASEPAALAAFWQDPNAHPPPGGERFGAFEQRVVVAWDALRADLAPGQRALLVTHGGVIRLLLCRVLGLPATRQFSFEVPYAARISVVLDGGDTRIRFESAAAE